MKPLTLLRPKVAGDKSPETSIEAGLGRKRCITFACGRRPNTHIKETQSVKSQTVADTGSTVATEPQKRPCLLTFACPFKPPLDEARKANKEPTFSKTLHHSPPSFETDFPDAMIYDRRPQVEPVQHFQDIMPRKRSLSPRLGHSRKSRIFNHQDLKRSEATSFHEFASSFDEGDEWIYEQTAHRHKITVNDTLRKENAIRKLGEEAEEEALDEEDVEGDEDSHEYLDEVASANDDFDGENHSSDGGNESDDEEGFADSDDSDAGSEYQFWTPALTTAATSTDHIRPVAQRTASESSFESIIHTQNMLPSEGDFAMRARKNRQVRSSSKMRPGTPDLPDSTDFVCGTFDEDRPLEVAYMSCLEERRRARHKLVPQDIDPSFPTSDSDDDHNCDSAAEASDEHMFIMGRPDKSDDEQLQSGREKGLSRRTAISPLPSPKPRRSPPPPKRHLVLRSPPPRRLFGHSPKHLRSPPATHGNWNSPPSSRRTSFSGSVRRAHEGIDMPHLAQRPNLTHTKSLPRTPNPFWRQHGKCRHDALVSTSIEKSLKPMGSQHSRGPIDIVKGLENKRQRRKEKYWRQQYRSGAKDRDCRCQPGKGAERMKELGLEIAGKGKGYGQKARLVLSV
ncbi:hypothetical protein MMC12_005489 [Toensbergia leucococca]|nr:hypothetical protein [Toensbergia leucococca]